VPNRISASCLCWFAFSVLSVVTPAQRTWIVDENKQPGWDFSDLPEAVSAASAGERILLRRGYYHGTRITKAVTVEGEVTPWSRPMLLSDLVVDQLPAGHRVVVTNLEFGFLYYFITPASLRCTNSAGTVHAQDCLLRGWAQSSGFVVSDCALVTAEGCTFTTACLRKDSQYNCDIVGLPAISAQRSNLHFTRCSITGESINAKNYACVLDECFATFSNCTVQGANRWCYYDLSCYCTRYRGVKSEAIVLRNSTIAFNGFDSQVSGGGQYCFECTLCPPDPVEAILAPLSSTILRDPGIAVRFSGVVREVPTVLPVLETVKSPTGDRYDLAFLNAPGGFCWLALGAPVARIPGPDFGLWIDPQSALVVLGGIVGPKIALQIPKGLPARLVVGLQAAFVSTTWTGVSTPTYLILD